MIRLYIILFLVFVPFHGFAQDALEKGQNFESQKKYSEAEKFYRQAFFEGNAKGALYLYDLNKKGHINVNDADDIKNIALKMIRKEADSGEGSAALDLGHFYLFGRYLKRDYDLADHYFRIADRAGKPIASYRLGMSYLEGLYNNVNPYKAVYYLQRASDQNVGRASRQIAIAYHLGIGKPKDLQKAISYYTKATKEGEALAMLDLANIYNYDLKNEELYEKLLLDAAKNNMSDAHYLLGKLYKSSNAEKSKFHFQQAAHMKHRLSRIELYGVY